MQLDFLKYFTLESFWDFPIFPLFFLTQQSINDKPFTHIIIFITILLRIGLSSFHPVLIHDNLVFLFFFSSFPRYHSCIWHIVSKTGQMSPNFGLAFIILSTKTARLFLPIHSFIFLSYSGVLCGVPLFTIVQPHLLSSFNLHLFISLSIIC